MKLSEMAEPSILLLNKYFVIIFIHHKTVTIVQTESKQRETELNQRKARSHVN